MRDTVGFLGVGNMGSALLKGAIGKGVLSNSQVWVFDRVLERGIRVSSELGVNLARDPEDLVSVANIIFVCVKPQDAKELLEGISGLELGGKILVSIMAGVSTQLIKALLRQEIPVIRAMPNTPLLVGEGVTALCYSGLPKKGTAYVVASIFQAVGKVIEVEEELMDVITAVAGSGPGFVFRIMEAFVQEAVEAGISRANSVEMVVQTFLGAAKLARETQKELSELREMVTSKGGTTEAGLKIFQELNLESGLKQMLQAATARSKALNQELSSKLSQ